VEIVEYVLRRVLSVEAVGYKEPEDEEISEEEDECTKNGVKCGGYLFIAEAGR
jgi:hypothetical protein